MDNKFYFLWDYNLPIINEFIEILDGRHKKGRLNQDWAMIRLLEHAKYDDIIRLLGYKIIIHWPRLREQIRTQGRKRGLDFLVEWLPEKHPELFVA